MSEPICRIDYMSWSKMQQLHRLVNSVRSYATYLEVDDHIRHVTEKIEDLFEGMVGVDRYKAIVESLRGLVQFVRTHRFEENEYEVAAVTGNIIRIIQGEDAMKKNQLIVTTFRLVKEAIDKTINEDATMEQCETIAEEYTARIVNDVFGAGKVTGNINEYVDKYYEMDPETEDVLHNGTLVVDGMKVLIEDPSLRQEMDGDMSAYDIYHARKKNRWATVESSKVEHHGHPVLTFIGAYEDGVKMKVVEDVNCAWIVKKDSIPRMDELVDRSDVVVFTARVSVMLTELRTMPGSALHRYKVKLGGTDIIASTEEYLASEGYCS